MLNRKLATIVQYAAVLVMSLVFVSNASAGLWITDTDTFPVRNGRYDSENGTTFGDDVQVEILSMSLTSPNPINVIPPPEIGTGDFFADSFFDVFFDISVDGGQTSTVYSFFDVSTKLSIINVSTSPEATPQQFNTEIISMSLTGAIPGGPTLIFRESQSLPSPGYHTIESRPGGEFAIDSFFDVFFELSVDDGRFIPAATPIRASLIIPEPGTLLLLGSGLLGLVGYTRKRFIV